jgi:hypothetical protein
MRSLRVARFSVATGFTTRNSQKTVSMCISALALSGLAIGLLLVVAAFSCPASRLLERLLVW